MRRKKTTTVQQEKKREGRKFRPAVFWKVPEERVWVQVSVSDHAIHDPLKRSRRSRKVADLLHSDEYSNEEIYETTEEVLSDLGLKVTRLSDRKKREESTKREPKRAIVDRETIVEAALAMKRGFKASEILPEASIPTGTIRAVLGRLVKEGKLRTVPKKGYEPE